MAERALSGATLEREPFKEPERTSAMTNAAKNSRHGHVFRPGPFHARRAYWLDSGVLHWRIGSGKGHAALVDIASMRVWLPPA